MKIIYLAAGYGVLDFENVVYQDIEIKRDLGGCMLEVDLKYYDVLIATPPCNYWSRANYRRETSVYSQKTKHLLPDIIDKFLLTGKPFIVENVINKVLMRDIINSFSGFYYEIGRHCYFTNIYLNDINFQFPPCNVQNLSKKQRQGSGGVNIVFNEFIKKIVNI